MNDRPVRIVLDASAVAAFFSGSEGLGEVIAEVNDEAAAFGLPVNCLAVVSDCTMREVLVRRSLAASTSVVGDLARASALVGAEEHRAWIVTAEPEAWKPLGDDP